MRKRVISFILCMAMVFMFLPATARAAEFSKQEFSLELNKKYSSYYLTFDDHNYEAYSVQMLDGTGVLPEGLDWRWNAIGIYLAGTPTKSGEYSVAFKIVRGDDRSELIHRVFITVGAGETSSEEMTLYTTADYSRKWLTFDDHNSEAITLDISDGELPEGLDWFWNAEGIYLKGSPTEPGVYCATFRVVRGDDGSVVRHSVTINVKEPEHSSEEIPFSVLQPIGRRWSPSLHGRAGIVPLQSMIMTVKRKMPHKIRYLCSGPRIMTVMCWHL